MKEFFYRVCYYWNSFNSNGAQFSESSTHLHVLGGVYNEIPSEEEMIKLLAEEDGLLEVNQVLNFEKPEVRNYGIKIVSFAEVKKEIHYREEKVCFIGAVRVPVQCPIEPIKGPSPITMELLSEATSYGSMGISDMGTDSEGDIVLVMDDHDFDPLWTLHGYDVSDESLEEINVTNNGFSDENFRCDWCQEIMGTVKNTWYTNRKFIEEPNEQIGVSCGCYKDYCLDHVAAFLNNPDMAIDPDAMTELKKQGKVTHHSDLYNGWSCGKDDPAEAISEIYEEAALGLFDIAEMDEEDFTEGMLFQVDCITPFDMGFSMWVYKNRQNTNKELLDHLQKAYEDTDWLEPGDYIAVVNTANPDTRDLWEEYYPDELAENNTYVMYATVIMKKDGGINEEFQMTQPKGSEYNALRADLIELDEWENVHDKTA